LAKVQTVLEICVNLMSFLGDEVHIFDKEIKNFERILICVNSRKFLYLSKKTLSPCYNNVQISLYRSRMTTKTTIKPVYKEVPSCCSGYIETATSSCTEGRI
jgi:hypothetical protein